MSEHIFILGGARSGKSRYAESIVSAMGPSPWVYIATAEIFDAEMRVRIEEHRARRGPEWQTLEAPHDLPAVLRARKDMREPILVDCLTLWLSNRLLAEADLKAESEALLAAIACLKAPLVLVSSEVGLGIVPDNALARAFRDAAGRLHQRIAATATKVILMVAGLPLFVKD